MLLIVWVAWTYWESRAAASSKRWALNSWKLARTSHQRKRWENWNFTTIGRAVKVAFTVAGNRNQYAETKFKEAARGKDFQSRRSGEWTWLVQKASDWLVDLDR